MNQLVLNNLTMPILDYCDCCIALTPFFHGDRILDFDVLIYVTAGTIYVTEETSDYAVNAGELLFLKSNVHHFGKYEIPRHTKWHFAHFHLPATGKLSSA